MFRAGRVSTIVSLLAAACQGEGPDPGAADAADAAAELAAGADLQGDAEGPADEAAIEATRAALAERGPFTVESWSEVLADPSRSTPPNGTFGGDTVRTLPATVWYPNRAEPSPLVIYCHGFMSTRTDNRAVMEVLASHGFVVAGIDFPLSSRNAPGDATVSDIPNQPGDVSFLIDTLLADSADPLHPLHGRIDAERMGVVGVSLGGLTALLIGHHPDYTDARIDVVVAAAPPACYAPVELLASRAAPLLLLHGDIDAIVPYASNALPAFEAAIPPKALVTIVNGNHTNFADAALVMAALPNPDTIGCTAIASQIPLDAVGPLAESLGGRTAAEVDAECPLPCATIDTVPPSIAVREQVDIFTSATVGWFRAFLTGDPAAQEFVTRGLEIQGKARASVALLPF